MRRIVVGISGASGAVFGQRVLQLLQRERDAESHLILTDSALRTIRHELDVEPDAICALADHVHAIDDVGAPTASGSFRADAMIVAPCSIRTLSAIAYSQTSNLLIRSADVMLKERRPLVLMVRETPLHLGHLRAMTSATEIGAIIAPPVPAMYTKPTSLDAMITQTAARALGLLGLDSAALVRWPMDGADGQADSPAGSRGQANSVP
jgi:flavin prenyltransferase